MPGTHSMRWLVFFVCGAFAALGCSTDIQQGDSASGSLSLDLVLADGIVINSATWTISGGDMEPMSGTINTSAPGSTASVEVFGLPPEDDYLVELEATSEDDDVTCRGSAKFDVEIGVATDVMVMLNCKRPPRFGGVRVNGKFNICATLAKVVVSPLQTSLGNDIDLSAIGVDEEGDDITYVWSNGAGTIGDPNAPETTYTCAEVGDHQITITISDDDFEYCMDDWTVPVTCVLGDDGDLCEEVDCDDDNECTDDECNPADGSCSNESVDDGASCEGDTGVCESGECVPADLCEGVDCDDGNECTDDLCDPETGECSNSAVDDGVDCGDGGMCVGGECVTTDLCEGVTCEDTDSDCTVGVCNMEDGECDEMNVEDGTECDEGAGLCSQGECIAGDLCDEVDCSSNDDCVQDGMCDPSSGECNPGDDEPADTPCSEVLFDGVCNGSGTCVECNDAGQCSGAPNECTALTCVDGACGNENVMDGAACDFQGSDGICESGTCVEAPECTSPGDCDDGNTCTAGDCVDGMCSFSPDDGGSCEVSPGVPGTCGGGSCVGLCDGVDCTSSNQCVQDGSCDDQTGDCIAGDNEPEGADCDQDGGTACDGAGMCVGAMPDDCGTTAEAVVTIGCTNGVTAAQSEFPNQLNITVDEPVFGGASFTVDANGVGAFPKFFLDAAQSTVPGGVRSAIIEGFNATMVAASGGTGSYLMQADAAGISPGLTRLCNFPAGLICTENTDCLGQVCFDPVLVIDVPIAEDCGPGGFCEGIGQGFADGPASQCNITDAPEFCVTGDLLVPLAGPSQVFAADVGPSEVLFAWAVDPATVTCPNADSRCASSGGSIPDRSLALPVSIYGDPVADPASIGLIGIRLNVAGALFVALQCSVAQGGGVCDAGTDVGLGCAVDAECPGGVCVTTTDVVVDSDPATFPSCPIN